MHALSRSLLGVWAWKGPYRHHAMCRYFHLTSCSNSAISSIPASSSPSSAPVRASRSSSARAEPVDVAAFQRYLQTLDVRSDTVVHEFTWPFHYSVPSSMESAAYQLLHHPLIRHDSGPFFRSTAILNGFKQLITKFAGQTHRHQDGGHSSESYLTLFGLASFRRLMSQALLPKIAKRRAADIVNRFDGGQDMIQIARSDYIITLTRLCRRFSAFCC